MASAGLHYTLHITHYTLHNTWSRRHLGRVRPASEIDDDGAPECGAGYLVPRQAADPVLGISSGITLCLIEECVWSADVLLLVQITSLAASTSTFISVLMIKQK